MSTKASIAFSHQKETSFHLYREAMEDDAIYLELDGEGVQYEVGAGHVTVRIPLEIWAIIREHKPVELPFAGWSDERVDAYVEAEVDKRIAEYQADHERNGGKRSLLAFVGCFNFGMADDPREQQIEHGRAHYRDVRDEQTEIQRRIDAIREENKGWNGLAVYRVEART